MTDLLAPTTAPFTVLVDTAETMPFEFTGLHADAVKLDRPLIVRTKWQCLGRHPHGLGDYAIEGFEGRCHVERKSMEDAQGTVLGWDSESDRQKGNLGRRQRFECELANLAKIEAAMVVVEATIGECLRTMPEWGKKDKTLNAKIFFRSVLAYQQDYRVPWMFCDGRRVAEQATYRFLERFWRHHKNEMKWDVAPLFCEKDQSHNATQGR